MKKKIAAFLLGLCATILCNVILAQDDLPKTLSFSRYEPILSHSPFAVATAAVVAPTMADFAKDLFIANAAHSAEGDWVALASNTDANFRKYLTTNQNVDGYSLSNIEWSDRVGETKDTVSKDGQFATLSFNQALLSSPLSRPGVYPNNVNMLNPAANMNPTMDLPQARVKAAPIPMLPTPPPRVRGVIKRNPQVPVMPQTQMQAPVAAPQTFEEAPVPDK
jgi:hypothetical protein